MTKKAKSKKAVSSVMGRPPIVAVLGHVDHGKTTLLDTIRKTHIAAREHGGITQSIGAYQVTTKEGKTITFIDTPGHEAFAKMRSRGATVADVALLVIAADDSVKPQTIESINQIKSAKIPYIVVVNKIDLPNSNPDRVKQDLAKHGVQVEGFGGDTPMVKISAKTGTGVNELLDLIMLLSEMQGLVNDPLGPMQSTVIETKIDKGKGMTASVIVKSGTLTAGTQMYVYDEMIGKVRAMFDEYGKRVINAGPGKPVEVLGFTKLPETGSLLQTVPTIKVPDVVVVKTDDADPAQLPDFLKPLDEEGDRKLNIIVKSDTAGSLEAIVQSFDRRIRIVSTGLGAVSEADILLAKSTSAFVIGFNVKFSSEIEKLVRSERVVVRTYEIIYKLIEELTEVVEGLKDSLVVERELGKGTVIAEFPFDNLRVAGVKVISGRLARGDMVRLMRENEEIMQAKIKSLRHGKADISKAEEGTECGVIFDRKVDFSLSDAIIAYST